MPPAHHANTAIRIAFSIVVVVLSACAKTSDPEHSGADIVAVPEGPWCEFNLSPDGAWLQYLGDESMHHPQDQQPLPHQRQAWFVNLATGQTEAAAPDPDVLDMIREGSGPDGPGCFSPDSTRVYYTRVLFKGERQGVADQQYSPEPRAGVSVTTPGRQVERLHYTVNLTQSPLTVTRAERADCAESAPAPRPQLRVDEVSDRKVRVLWEDGTLLGEHRPRGWSSRRISAWEPDSPEAMQSYLLSPDQRHMAYRVYETNLLGFSAPTHGYLAELGTGAEASTRFLGASLNSMQWSARNHLFACTSHSAHRAVIARWIP